MVRGVYVALEIGRHLGRGDRGRSVIEESHHAMRPWHRHALIEFLEFGELISPRYGRFLAGYEREHWLASGPHRRQEARQDRGMLVQPPRIRPRLRT